MLIGVIADDFTGASDIANTLAKGNGGTPGLLTTQFMGIPKVQAPENCEAGVVSLKSRSIPADEAVAQSLAALAWLKEQGCSQIIFKYCSTFDSTPAGNIGPVAEALANALGVKGVVVCPAFPGAGRTVYQGNLFVGDVPLNESSLRNHPLNPMTDSDIRRWLRLQSRESVGFVPWSVVEQGTGAIRVALNDAAKRGETLVVVDAVRNEDLLEIGKAVAAAPLITGGSGIALGLPNNFSARNNNGQMPVRIAGVTGPDAILAGSCSQATLAQVAYHSKSHPAMAVSTDEVMSGSLDASHLVAFIEKNWDKSPLVYSSDEPSRVAAAQELYGREEVAARLDALFAETAKQLVERGVRRLVVAGGETSGAVVSGLGLEALTIGPEIAPGVPVLVSPQPLALALKSGNFGQEDFFERALRMMENGN